jgi:hypothetical protein
MDIGLLPHPKKRLAYTVVKMIPKKRLTLTSVQLLMGMAGVLTACNNGNHTDNMQGMDHSKMEHGSSGATEQVTQNLLTLNTKNVTRVNHDDPVKVAVETS